MIEIRTTRARGRGLFATERIRQGQTIVELPETTQAFPDRYSIEAKPGVHIDCSTSAAGALNHSCDANARVRDFRVTAWRCIEAGEEVTLDYRLTERKLAEPFRCADCARVIS